MYSAVRVGNRFAAICKNGVQGNVHSIFSKTMNIEIKEYDVPISLLTLCRTDADISQSSLITSMGNDQSWQFLNIKIGGHVIFTQKTVSLEDMVLVNHINKAYYWQPKSVTDLQNLPHLRYEDIKGHCEAVSSYIKICAEKNSVYTFITRLSDIHGQIYAGFNKGDYFSQMFAQGVKALQQTIRKPTSTSHDFDASVRGLLGLGGGLTPSGDDFLSGVLHSMHFVQKVFGIECLALPLLAGAVYRNAWSLTNQISQHFLRYAAEGMWDYATEEFLLAVFRCGNKGNGTLFQAVDRKLLYGATSGMDEILGLMFGACEAIRVFGR